MRRHLPACYASYKSHSSSPSPCCAGPGIGAAVTPVYGSRGLVATRSARGLRAHAAQHGNLGPVLHRLISPSLSPLLLALRRRTAAAGSCLICRESCSIKSRRSSRRRRERRSRTAATRTRSPWFCAASRSSSAPRARSRRTRSSQSASSSSRRTWRLSASRTCAGGRGRRSGRSRTLISFETHSHTHRTNPMSCRRSRACTFLTILQCSRFSNCNEYPPNLSPSIVSLFTEKRTSRSCFDDEYCSLPR